MADPSQTAATAGQRALWFISPDENETRRRALTRERVVAEALAVISADGVDALSMRALAARLGVVPGALYRHVRSKEQLCDLVVDGVLAEIDCQVDARSAGPGMSRCSRTGCGRSWKAIRALPGCSRPAIPSDCTGRRLAVGIALGCSVILLPAAALASPAGLGSPTRFAAAPP